eukprot:424135-Prymnesium_polylepis.1
MPTVGRAFSADLSAVLSGFDDGQRQEKMRAILTDGECFHCSGRTTRGATPTWRRLSTTCW